MKNTLIAFVGLFLTNVAFAHSGGTDANGCHNDSSTNTVHCHTDDNGSVSDGYDDLNYALGHLANITFGLYAVSEYYVDTIDNDAIQFEVGLLGIGAGLTRKLNTNLSLYAHSHITGLSESSLTFGGIFKVNKKISVQAGLGYHVAVASFALEQNELVENYSHVALVVEAGAQYKLSSNTSVGALYDFEGQKAWLQYQVKK